ncbi:hypothetical protein [Paenibacillus marinisediminis]
MKRLLYVIISVIVISILISGCGYNSLQEAVQSQWETPISIKNEDKEHRLVIYLDQTQYVFGVYKYKNHKYYYDNSQSSGWRTSPDNGIPLLVVAEQKEGIGNFIWGAVYTDIPAKRIVIEYENGERQETNAVNNTFILEMPESFNSIEPHMFMGKLYDVTAYDEDDQVLVEW